MTMFLSSGPGAGLEPRRQEVTLTAVAALTKGDMTAIDPAVDTNGRFYKTRASAAASDTIYGLSVGFRVVALENIATGANGRFLVSGITDVLVDGTANVAAGQPLCAVANEENMAIATTANNKVFGYALAAQAADSAVLTSVMFNGIDGFGTVVTT